MNLGLVKTAGTRLLGRGLLHVQKHAPEILMAVGIGSGIASTVLAVKATYELVANDELSKARELKEGTQRIYDAWISDRDHGTNKLKKQFNLDSYSEEQFKRDTVIYYVRVVQTLAKKYALPVALGATALACVLGAHGLMKQRNAALMVAYNALDAAFKEYRKKVVEDQGEEKDQEYMNSNRFEEVEVVKDNGKKTVEKKIKASDAMSPYARLFDQSNLNWQKNAEYNLYFLRVQETFANNRLKARGHVFLNEIYEGLGIPHSRQGALVGWVDDGSNHISFGINDPVYDSDGIWLDFNVQGLIYDKI